MIALNNNNDIYLSIPENYLHKWQNLLNTLCKIGNVPAALIMQINGSEIEVFLSSKNDDNPYKVGDKELLVESGLYCENVIKNKNKLLVPNALKDSDWKNNPDIKLNMISYLGFPIIYGNNKIFGTICILDKKENSYSIEIETLIQDFRDIIQDNLNIVYMNNLLEDNNKNLSDYINEIKILRGIISICSFCNRIKNEDGEYERLELYIKRHSEASFSHGICTECAKKQYPEVFNKIKKK